MQLLEEINLKLYIARNKGDRSITETVTKEMPRSDI